MTPVLEDKFGGQRGPEQGLVLYLAECLYLLCTSPGLLDYSTQLSPESQTVYSYVLHWH